MFGSKDVCILKTTIDFNGSMNTRTLSDPSCVRAALVCHNMRVYICTGKYVLKKKKKGKGTLFWKGIDKCMINARSRNLCLLYDVFSHRRTNTREKATQSVSISQCHSTIGLDHDDGNALETDVKHIPCQNYRNSSTFNSSWVLFVFILALLQRKYLPTHLEPKQPARPPCDDIASKTIRKCIGQHLHSKFSHYR